MQISLTPIQEAAAQMSARTVVGSPMLSRQWALVPAEIRFRAMFSARVEHERTLAEMQERITDAMAGMKRDGATMDRSRFIEEMRPIIQQSGYRRPDGSGKKSLTNLKSRRRLELIWNMNTAQASGYAKWLSDMDPDGLENEPCYELTRIMARQEPRDWFAVWLREGGKLYDGRMIARKTSQIWTAISRFGTPWPPFDWGSGMGLMDISRTEAEALGVISPDDPPDEPLPTPFNAAHSASAQGIPSDGRARIVAAFAGEVVETQDNRLRLLPPPAPAPLYVFPLVAQTMIRRAADALQDLSAADVEKLTAAIRHTAAWQRYAASGGNESAESGTVRALAQFLADDAGREAIAEVRASTHRDAFWSPADFVPVEMLLRMLLKGGAE
jgi:hypothetical protein